ncbi:ATG C terminal domain-containing protein [Cardiosporidium cionae]|uniref:Autophagy-related protein 2 n=1 Tax=Cardiosporidium cionae TaxID=476202 RepID=A0ABQ7J5A9_9APIC|nr:ATG C terminal domain-containing protein [Cardiosporidium cionae]|eukprot:KAF8817971.1 ATG C terminal domain-containing protein [Cardiosporidium cionae]
MHRELYKKGNLTEKTKEKSFQWLNPMMTEKDLNIFIACQCESAELCLRRGSHFPTDTTLSWKHPLISIVCKTASVAVNMFEPTAALPKFTGKLTKRVLIAIKDLKIIDQVSCSAYKFVLQSDEKFFPTMDSSMLHCALDEISFISPLLNEGQTGYFPTESPSLSLPPTVLALRKEYSICLGVSPLRITLDQRTLDSLDDFIVQLAFASAIELPTASFSLFSDISLKAATETTKNNTFNTFKGSSSPPFATSASPPVSASHISPSHASMMAPHLEKGATSSSGHALPPPSPYFPSSTAVLSEGEEIPPRPSLSLHPPPPTSSSRSDSPGEWRPWRLSSFSLETTPPPSPTDPTQGDASSEGKMAFSVSLEAPVGAKELPRRTPPPVLINFSSYIRRFEIDNISFKIDYRPRSMNAVGIREGDIRELLNFLATFCAVEGLELSIRRKVMSDIKGFGDLCTQYAELCINDFDRKQFVQWLSSIPPIHSFYAIGKQIKLSVMEVSQLCSNLIEGHSSRTGATAYISLQMIKTLGRFTKSCAVESLNFSERALRTSHGLLVKVDRHFTPGTLSPYPTTLFHRPLDTDRVIETDVIAFSNSSSSCSSESESSISESFDPRRSTHKSKEGKNQNLSRGVRTPHSPSRRSDISFSEEEWSIVEIGSANYFQPTNFQEGISQATSCFFRGFSNASSAASRFLIPRELSIDAIHCIVKFLPIFLLRPVLGYVEAVTCTLQGFRNNLDQSVLQERRRVFKGPKSLAKDDKTEL